MTCNNSCSTKYSNTKCLTALKKINDLEILINIQLAKAKLLLELLNCENLDKIKELLLKIFEEIKKLENGVSVAKQPQIEPSEP